MHSATTCGVIAVTLSCFVQLCPAPPVVVAAAITAGGAFIGGAVSTAGNRDVRGLYDYDTATVEDGEFVQLRDAAPVDVAVPESESLELRGTEAAEAVAIPPGVPKQDYKRCVKELKSASVVVQAPVKNHGIRARGVPPTCMTLATVLAGDPVNGPYPTPCGSACLLDNNLTNKQYNKLRKIFLQHS